MTDDVKRERVAADFGLVSEARLSTEQRAALNRLLVAVNGRQQPDQKRASDFVARERALVAYEQRIEQEVRSIAGGHVEGDPKDQAIDELLQLITEYADFAGRTRPPCSTCGGIGVVERDECLVPCSDCDGIHNRIAEWNAAARGASPPPTEASERFADVTDDEAGMCWDVFFNSDKPAPFNQLRDALNYLVKQRRTAPTGRSPSDD